MYSETDIEAAVAAGALTPQAAQALRDSVAAGRAAPAVDEESFRLVTGFNDIFVTIAAILLLVAVGWIGMSSGELLGKGFDVEFSHLTRRFGEGIGFSFVCSGILSAGTSWLLAEYFTRVRRMALPSIILLAAFVIAFAIALEGCHVLAFPDSGPRAQALAGSLIALITAGAAWLHWRRFHVPITIAALTGALVAMVLALLLAIVPGAIDALLWLLLAAGLSVFAFAMWWDMSDRTRITRRSDVAFWLHLAAAPMIAHPVFNLLGVLDGGTGAGRAIVVLLLYLLFGVVALAVDRRALLVSGLVYVLLALAGLFRQAGAVSLSIAFTALVIGSALLLLSAFWAAARRQVVKRLPADLQARLPALDRLAYMAPPRPA